MRPVAENVVLVAPGHRAGGLVMGRHGAAVVGSIAQKSGNEIGIPGDKPERSPGRLERLDRLWNTRQLR